MTYDVNECFTIYVANDPALCLVFFDKMLISYLQDVIDHDMISQMTYLDMCVQETLRMYPPIIRSMS